ncbi:MAG: SPOR domain-containing protein [Holophaga sp.]|nr:SPOR domain-containing protein [Holophaga sp.]
MDHTPAGLRFDTAPGPFGRYTFPMSDRDTQTVLLSRPTVLLVTGVGVGLLTLTYVLGVQVGKQSAALRQSPNRAAGEELTELPASLDDQLKQFDNRELDKAVKAEASKEVTKAPEPTKETSEVKAKPDVKPEVPKGSERWTLQIVATSDEAEAKRVAAKIKGAGFKPAIVKVKNQFKVRLASSGTRAEMDAVSAKLKAKGLASFLVKAE